MLPALARLHPILRSHPALSLVELIIAMTVFLILLSSGIVMVSQVSQAAKKVEMEEYLHTETQALLERLGRDIRNAGIDYEEYYSQKVIQATVSSPTYGDNYGEYHKQFFHPGYPAPPNSSAGPEADGYGAYCVDGITAFDPNTSICMPLTSTFDFDTGSNPYGGSSSTLETANAVCEGNSTCSTNLLFHELDELYLINHAGNLKTVIALKTVNGVKQLATVQLQGTDADGNGISESWACTSDFTCAGLPTNSNLVPISPKNLAIQWIKFYISPIEDPFKGYNETTNTTFQSVQQKPRVTMVINARYQLYDPTGVPIAFDQTKSYIGEPPEITLQTTISTSASNIIPAYSFP